MRGGILVSIYVMSDVHGNFEAFKEMLKKINFSKEDHIILNGDIIDRGKDSYKMIQFVRSTPNAFMLLGNHELMMIQYFTQGDITWFSNGGVSTLRNLECNHVDVDELVSWAKSLPAVLETEVNDQKFLIGHANPFSEWEENIVWERLKPNYINKPSGYEDVIAIVGHTPTTVFQPSLNKAKIIHDAVANVFFIDCGGGYPNDDSSRLACIRLDDMKEFYVDLKDYK